ncbi:MAG: hypothetical protein KJ606_07945 [Chloroflexi bacterium]|nr:hypothetical protein [Chloroflexota bacterium]
MIDLVMAGSAQPQVIETGHDRQDEDDDHQQGFDIPTYPAEGKVQPVRALFDRSFSHHYLINRHYR